MKLRAWAPGARSPQIVEGPCYDAALALAVRAGAERVVDERGDIYRRDGPDAWRKIGREAWRGERDKLLASMSAAAMPPSVAIQRFRTVLTMWQASRGIVFTATPGYRPDEIVAYLKQME